MMRITCLVLLFLVSCTSKSIQSIIMEADRVEIIDTETNFSYTETRKEVVQEFKNAFNNPAGPVDCVPQGTVLFRKGDETLFRAGYYKDASACNMFIVEDGGKKTGYRYNYNVLVYLGVYFQNLKKQHNAGHN